MAGPLKLTYAVAAYRDLRAMSDEQLIETQPGDGNDAAGTRYYRDELLRRDSARAATELIKLTRGLWFLTVAVALAAIVALIIGSR